MVQSFVFVMLSVFEVPEWRERVGAGGAISSFKYGGGVAVDALMSEETDLVFNPG